MGRCIAAVVGKRAQHRIDTLLIARGSQAAAGIARQVVTARSQRRAGIAVDADRRASQNRLLQDDRLRTVIHVERVAVVAI